eukprot:486778-Karenia_brevis.AAC.1
MMMRMMRMRMVMMLSPNPSHHSHGPSLRPSTSLAPAPALQAPVTQLPVAHISPERPSMVNDSNL